MPNDDIVPVDHWTWKDCFHRTVQMEDGEWTYIPRPLETTTENKHTVRATKFMQRIWSRPTTNEWWTAQILQADDPTPIPFAWRVRRGRSASSRGNVEIKREAYSLDDAISAVHDYMASLGTKLS